MAKNEAGQEVNDQHINTSGRARLLSVGKYLPPDWGWVRVTKTRSTPDGVWLYIKKLALVDSSSVQAEKPKSK